MSESVAEKMARLAAAQGTPVDVVSHDGGRAPDAGSQEVLRLVEQETSDLAKQKALMEAVMLPREAFEAGLADLKALVGYKQAAPLRRLYDKATTARQRAAKKPNQSENGYVIHDGCICLDRVDDDPLPLCDFTATIEAVEEYVGDEAEEAVKKFRITGADKLGRPLKPLTVPAGRFNTLDWASEWLPRVSANPGFGIQQKLAFAIRTLSAAGHDGQFPTRYIYQHTGWHTIDGEPHYLFNGGAINEGGLRDDISVRLPQSLTPYKLEMPGSKKALRDGLRLLMKTARVVPEKPEIGYALIASLFRSPTEFIEFTDYLLNIVGPTGSGKSALLNMLLRAKGDWDDDKFPARWRDTEASIDHKLNHARDTITVIDDYKARGLSYKARGVLDDKANAVIHEGIGNRAEKSRMRADMTQQRAFFPRGTVLSTGEEVATGSPSMMARSVWAEVGLSDVDWTLLTELQQAGEAGTFRQVMGGFIHWLAPRLGAIKENWDTHQYRGRAEFTHRRYPDTLGSMMAGIGLLLDWSKDDKLLTPKMMAQHRAAAETNLMSLMLGQDRYQTLADEASQFIRLLSEMFNAGVAHLEPKHGDAEALTRSGLAEAVGWLPPLPASNEELGSRTARPRGASIGWVNPQAELLYLLPQATVHHMGKFATETLLFSERTIGRHLMAKGMLHEVSGNKGHEHTKRIRHGSVGGSGTAWVWVISLSVLMGDEDENGDA